MKMNLSRNLEKEGLSIEESEGTEVFLQWNIHRKCKEPKEFVSNIREKRRIRNLPLQMNVRDYTEFKVILISTEPGRVLRPLIIADNGVPRLTDEHLIQVEQEN